MMLMLNLKNSGILIFIFFCSALLTIDPAQAVRVKGIYQAEVPVENQSAASRRDAFRQAIKKVLIKMTGIKDIAAAPEAEIIIQRATRYVSRYRYMQKALDESTAVEEPGKQLFINVEYDGEALEKLLRQSGLPVWSDNRPAVLLWLAVQNGRERYILGEDTDDEIKRLVMAAADRRGVPLIFPLQDLEETRRVTFADIRAGFTETVLAASERYNAPITMVGYLKFDRSGKASVKWTTHREGSSSSWQERSVPQEQAVISGIDNLADILASRYAFSGNAGNTLFEYLVSVNGVLGLNDYAGALNYMRGLNFVEEVTPVRVEAGRAHYRVLMRGELMELQRMLDLSELLQPEAIPGSSLPLLAAQQTGLGVSSRSLRDRVDLYYMIKR